MPDIEKYKVLREGTNLKPVNLGDVNFSEVNRYLADSMKETLEEETEIAKKIFGVR